jgi:hypothetical protein
LAPGGILVSWKRGDLVDETAAAQRALAAMGGGSIESVPVAVTGLDDHRLVVVSARGATPAAYPRDPSARRQRPW